MVRRLFRVRSLMGVHHAVAALDHPRHLPHVIGAPHHFHHPIMAAHLVFSLRRLGRRGALLCEYRGCCDETTEYGSGSDGRDQLADHVFFLSGAVGEVLTSHRAGLVVLSPDVGRGGRFVLRRGLCGARLLAVMHALHAHEHHCGTRQDIEQRQQIGDRERMLTQSERASDRDRRYRRRDDEAAASAEPTRRALSANMTRGTSGLGDCLSICRSHRCISIKRKA